MAKNYIAIVPGSSAFEDNELFNKNNKYNYDGRLMPYYLLKKELSKSDIEVNTIDMFSDLDKIDLVFFQTLRYDYIYTCLKNGLKNKLIYIAIEPPVVEKNNCKRNLKKIENMFQYILTWRDDFVDGEKYIKYFFPQYFGKEIRKEIPFNKKKLLTNISGAKTSNHPQELYSERLKIIKYFERNHSNHFDFYGRGWDKFKHFKNYKGEIKSKLEIYSKYKFALCFENMKNVDGYITEKIFDCFKARLVPIYWGATNVNDYIPRDCYIDYRQFKNPSRLYDYISHISEKEYNKYIRSINLYMASDQKKDFSTDNFINTIKKISLNCKNKNELIDFKSIVFIIRKNYYMSIKKYLKGLLNKND